MSPATQAVLGPTLEWLLHHGYPLMLVAMIFEGPLVIMAASFAASMGYFNLWIVTLLALAGDLIGDLIWFTLGRFGRLSLQPRLQRRFGASWDRMWHIGELIERHPGKTLLAVKLSPFAAVPGLMAVGASRLSILRFVFFALLVIVPKTTVFVLLGYSFSHAYSTIALYLQGKTFAAVTVVILTLLAYFAYTRLTRRISRNLED